jgi:hypothetical protein
LSIRVGKDVLDLISGAMYIEPLTIYRELIQNSTDAIDSRSPPSFKQPGAILVTLDRATRSISVQDNGAGIKQSIAAQILTSVGDSAKRGTDARGFRGVGRLAGLGYCKKLRFETKAAKEAKKTIVEWDGIKFRQKIKDPDYSNNLEQLIQDITSVEKASCDPKATLDSFFCVTLVGVARLPLDRLLNEETVTNYISQHCPVPFSQEFVQKDEVESFLKQHLAYKAYEVSLRSSTENSIFASEQLTTQIFRPFGNAINDVEIHDTDIQTSLIQTPNGLNAIWYINHELSGAIPKAHGIRGLRARQKNIQIGEEGIFAGLFREERFNSWICGEVHIGDQTILPNGRRDSFEPGPSFSQLETKLYEIAHQLSTKCRRDSKVRNYERKVDNELESLTKLVTTLKRAKVPPAILGNLTTDLGAQLVSLEARILAGDNTKKHGRKRKVSNIRKNLSSTISRKPTSAPNLNGHDESLLLNAVFEEIVSVTPDKAKAVQIIADSLIKIKKLVASEKKHQP